MMRTIVPAQCQLRAGLPALTPRQLMAAAILACALPPAQAIHRCESDGKVSYSDLPCSGATPLAIDDSQPSP